ncbi:MAG: efflux RND transporter periplasmic adaptor subunit [Ignavibacteriae bacterium]|jgi:RND family efflux transporter MFP subunit|nr:efflux RND transporter periplasmic adaptor subunit [Ignavibacteriota bacterium]NOG97922.1 efflux RND transporter periplasmic adaptor subunit [Ignavibacteriota bacterium]
MMKLYHIGILLLFILASCGGDDEKSETVRPVFYKKVTEISAGSTRNFAGVSQAQKEVRLSFKVGGTLDKIYVRLGEAVQKGELIAALDDTDYKLNYEKAVSSQKNGEVQLTIARSNFNRIEKLYANNNVSLSEYEKVKAEFESAKSMVQTAQTQLSAAKNQLDYTKLTAPFNGTVSSILAEENEMTGAGMPVVLFATESNVEIKTAVPENIIRFIKKGQKVNITFSSIPNKVFVGQISEVGLSSQTASTFPLIISLTDESKKVLPGMSCSVQIPITSGTNLAGLIEVPFDAVAHDSEGDFVYVINSTEKAGVYRVERRDVLIGEYSPAGYEIKKGLKPDELIVTAGLSFMYDGRPVNLLESSN